MNSSTVSPEGCTVKKTGYERGKRKQKKKKLKREEKNREKFVRTFSRNNSSYFSCNIYTVLEFSRSVSCCSDVQLAGLQLAVPKKPPCLFRGHFCHGKESLVYLPFQLSREAEGFVQGGLIQCAPGMHSVTTMDTTMSKMLLDGC